MQQGTRYDEICELVVAYNKQSISHKKRLNVIKYFRQIVMPYF